ncbi:uncharacterized protein [Henckelia pumila]|uniref:uncharacterized protein n=1 Tax=Henckelia pumila TaxID=405737 RepID=UPI003C6DF22F
MKPQGVTKEQIPLRAFPFSLKNAAKDWLYYQPTGSITTWTEMKRIFQENYFPASRAANIRKEIYGIKHNMGESLHEYWEREWTNVKKCGICAAMGHSTEMCPTLQEETVKQVNATRRFPGPPQQNYDLYLNTYNPGLTNDKESKVEEDEDEIVQKDTPKGMPKNRIWRIGLCSDSEKIPAKCKDPGPLKETSIVIQMADRSTIYPRGVIEDALVKVGNLVFPAEFYVLDMKTKDLNSPILQGRSFLKTSNSVINVNNCTLTMEFDGEIVNFNIFDTLKFPSGENVVNTLHINDHLSQENKKVVNEDKLKKVIAKPAENSNAKFFLYDLQACKTESKLPPDRAKGIPIGKGRNHPEMGISKKFKERNHGPKLTVKILKLVKLDKGTRYEQP